MPDGPTEIPRKEESRRGISLRRVLIGTVAAAVISLTVIALLGDTEGVQDAFRAFDWRLAPVILLLTVWNYAWRFVKWRRFLRALDVPPITLRTDLLIYLSGYALTITPGKVGELVRSVYIRRFTGAPANRTAAAVAAERISDGAAMLVLALVGLLEYSYGRPFVAIAAIALLAGFLFMQRPALLHTLIDQATNIGRFRGGIAHARAFLNASTVLFRPRQFAPAIGIGIISWSGECLAFFLILVGLGINATWSLLLAATFILAVSSLAGGASMLPGGLGVTDATVAGMLLLLIDDPSMSRSVAAAATLIIRFATLWFAVLIGAIAMAMLERQSRRLAEPAVNIAASEH